MERRLTTILSLDVVGYSGLMAADEAGTLTQLKAHRKEVMEPKTSEYGGRVVKLMGDGTLMEFGSVVDAVHFAVDVQQAIAKQNAKLPENQRITYRVGINIGDIIVEGDDIYGDGVNIAARLEGLADPGGICVARNVVDQVKTKVDVRFEDLGEQAVKNIPEPVQVYRVLLHVPTASHAITAAKPKRAILWPAAASALAVLVIVVGFVVWQQPLGPREEPASEAKMAFPLPDKPSIAVLPFNNMSDDASQEYFADGMTEDLITDLSKISGLFVIARNSVFTYKGQAVEIRQVAEDLGVRYVLEGSVRRAADRVRINAQLIDATTGGHLWAERYDGALDDVFALQDRITEKIVNALSLELTSQEAQVVSAIGTKIAKAHEAYLLGLSFYHRQTPEGFKEAKDHFGQAVDLDPDYSAAHIALAKLYAQAKYLTFARALGVNTFDAAGTARLSLARAEAEGQADYHVVRSWLALAKHQHGRAVTEAKRALSLDPNNVDALLALAEALIFSGKPQPGIDLAERALRQSPTLQAHPLMLLGLAEFVKGNFERAADSIARAFKLGSGKTTFLPILAAALAKLGQTTQAQAALTEFQESYFGLRDLARVMIYFPFADSKHLEALAEGLMLSGAKVFYTLADGGYMRLTASNQLNGSDIESLLSGAKIEGKGFWLPSPWQRTATNAGGMVYTGFAYEAVIPLEKVGTARIDGNLLCELWPDAPEVPELCSAIFRIEGDNAQARWGEYVLRTDSGPQPFWTSD